MRTTATDDNGVPGLDTPAGTVTLQRTHVVATAALPGELVLYVDGLERARAPNAGDLSPWIGWPLVIGNELTLDRAFRGEFHLVAVYGRALSAAEVARNFTAGP